MKIIKKIGKNKYKARVSLGYAKDALTGKLLQKKKQITFQATSDLEAEIYVAKYIDKNRTELKGLKIIGTMNQLIAAYYADHPKLKAKTLSTDRYYKDIIIKAFGNMELKKITAENIRDFLTELKTRYDYADGTLHSFFKNLNKYLNYAVEQEWLGKNPMSKLKESIGSSPNYKKRHINEQDFKSVVKLMMSSPNKRPFTHELKTQLLLMLDGCLRNAELYGLTWTKINLQEKYMLVRNTAVTLTAKEAKRQNAENHKLDTVKTDGSERKVPLSAITVRYLEEYKASCEKYLQKHNLDNKEQIVFFQHRNNKGNDQVKFAYGSGFRQNVDNICSKYNHEHLSPHDFRRMGYTFRLNESIPKVCCDYLLGHNPDNCTDVYIMSMYKLAKDHHVVWEEFLMKLLA